jgi:5-methylcytosine-specific restriction endonuclease McrA
MTYERAGTSIYRTPQWKALRLQAKRRDGFACVQCKASGDLEVDHIKPIRTHPELALVLSNLQCLCIACHSRKTRLEIGLGELTPEREAWKSLLRDMRHNPQAMRKKHA